MSQPHDHNATTQAWLPVAGIVPAFLACPLFTNRKAKPMLHECRMCSRPRKAGSEYCENPAHNSEAEQQLQEEGACCRPDLDLSPCGLLRGFCWAVLLFGVLAIGSPGKTGDYVALSMAVAVFGLMLLTREHA